MKIIAFLTAGLNKGITVNMYSDLLYNSLKYSSLSPELVLELAIVNNRSNSTISESRILSLLICCNLTAIFDLVKYTPKGIPIGGIVSFSSIAFVSVQ